jgi:hypothetical protein
VREVLHPAEIGFKKTASLIPESPGSWRYVYAPPLDRAKVPRIGLYVFCCAERVFRIGQTTELRSRINGYLRVMRECEGGTLDRKWEVEDGRRMRRCTQGGPFDVWTKEAPRILIDHIPRFPRSVAALQAEEDYLIDYYRPEWNDVRTGICIEPTGPAG